MPAEKKTKAHTQGHGFRGSESASGFKCRFFETVFDLIREQKPRRSRDYLSAIPLALSKNANREQTYRTPAGFRSPLFRHKRHDSRFHMYPNKLGRKILRHPATRMLEQKLPHAVFCHLWNGLNWVFAGKRPETMLDPLLHENLSEKFLRDSETLRKLTGLA